MFIHPSSLNFSCGRFESGWLCYTDMVETSKVCQILGRFSRVSRNLFCDVLLSQSHVEESEPAYPFPTLARIRVAERGGGGG